MTDTPPPVANDNAKTVTPRISGGLRALLIGSLAVNLLFVGVVGGGMIAGRGAPHPFSAGEMTLGPFADALEGADRDTVRERLRDRIDQRRTDRATRDVALQEFLLALRADPFDPAAIEAIFADQRDKATEGLAAGQEVLLERITAMSPAARAGFADRLERRLDGGRGRH